MIYFVNNDITSSKMDPATINHRHRRRGTQGNQSSHKRDTNTNRRQIPHSSPATVNHTNTPSFRPHKTLLVRLTENTPTWYECGRNTPGRDDTVFSVFGPKQNHKSHHYSQQTPAALVNKYRSLATLIYEQEMILSRENISAKMSSDEQWLESAVHKGTLKDRIAAMAVLVRSDPVHKMHTLDKLLQLAGVVLPHQQGLSLSAAAAAGEPSSQVEASRKNTSSGHFHVRINQLAAEALVDLFIHALLPKDRKLYTLDKRPLHLYEDYSKAPPNTAAITTTSTAKSQSSTKDHTNHTSRTLSSRILLLWKFEEMLKAKYTLFLTQYLSKALSQNATSSLEHYKIVVLGTASTLLAEIPEGEHILLTMIVNKLGDPSRKIAAAAGHRLRSILEAHPNMTPIMAREVQQLAYRPHLTSRALYNCIIFLNQLKLTHEYDDGMDNDASDKNHLPSSLIKTYFQLFEVAVRKSQALEKGSLSNPSMKGRLLSALLTGVNRTRPYLSTKNIQMEEHVEALYRIAHTSPPAAACQALMLLFHLSISPTRNSESTSQSSKATMNNNINSTNKQDRFYRALYSKLMDTDMYSGRHVTLFFNLVYKSMKCDPDSLRIMAFSKRLLHTATHQNAAICSGTIFLLSEVGKHKPIIHELIATCPSSENRPLVFDSTKREPKGAFKASENDNGSIRILDNLWEICLCVSHYHPTVVKFAQSMSDINYQGDPLKDITLTHFLDKFAFRNPKSVDKIAKQLKRGESVGEKRSGIEGKLSSLSATPVNNPEFWSSDRQGVTTLTESDDFFKTFFRERAKRDEVKGIMRNKHMEGDDYALDAAEGKEVDFDGDDTDSEEEAFVEQLAQQIMKKSGKGKAHYDDEDPDMDDWGDLEENDNELEDDVDDDEFEDDVDNADNDGDIEVDVDQHDGDDLDDEFDDDNDEIDIQSDTDEDVTPSKNVRGGKNINKNSSVFAAAEDYEKIITESISRGKRKIENWKEGTSKKKR